MKTVFWQVISWMRLLSLSAKVDFQTQNTYVYFLFIASFREWKNITSPFKSNLKAKIHINVTPLCKLKEFTTCVLVYLLSSQSNLCLDISSCTDIKIYYLEAININLILLWRFIVYNLKRNSGEGYHLHQAGKTLTVKNLITWPNGYISFM